MTNVILRNVAILPTLVLFFMIFPVPGHAISTTNFYVSSVRELEDARDAVRKLQPLKSPVNIYLKAGTYELEKPFTLDEGDSGTKDFPITYQANPGEKVVLSGARKISGAWSQYPQNKNIYYIDTPFKFNSLFVNGRRAIRARAPNVDSVFPYFQIAGKDAADTASFFYGNDTGSLNVDNLPGAEVVSFRRFLQSRSNIASVSAVDKKITTTGPVQYGFGFENHGEGDRYFVENSLDLLDSPGEWYLDKTAGRLYYYPLADEDVQYSEFLAPVLKQLLKLGWAGDSAFDAQAQVPSQDADLGISNFTISVWLRFPATGGVPQTILAKGYPWKNGYALKTRQATSSILNPDGTVKVDKKDLIGITFSLGRANKKVFVTNMDVPRDQWVHYAFTVDRHYAGVLNGQPIVAERFANYLNGKLLISGWIPGGSVPSDLSNDDALSIGSLDDAAAGTMISGLNIWKRCLSNTEITRLSAGEALSSADLALSLPLNDQIQDVRFAGAPQFVTTDGRRGLSFSSAQDIRTDQFETYVGPVRYINFQGLEFAFTDWEMSGSGYAGYASSSTLRSPPAISWVAENCVFSKNVIEHTGADGLRAFGRNLTISNNRINDIGARGITLGFLHNSENYRFLAYFSSSNLIDNNRVFSVGKVFYEGIPICAFTSRDSKFSRNLIYDGGYTGLHVGGYTPDLPNIDDGDIISGRNIIENNEIHHVMQELDDGGGIYIIGNQPGSEVRLNKVHDIVKTARHLFGSIYLWGIYMDATCTDLRVHHNWVYRTESGGPLFQAWKDLSARPATTFIWNRDNVVSNNIFVDGVRYQIFANRSALDYLDRNIIYYKSAPGIKRELFFTLMSDALKEADRNLYYATNTEDIENSSSWAKWKGLGFDKNSIVKDPLFVNYDADDFNLRVDSPAMKSVEQGGIGFERFDLNSVGVRPEFDEIGDKAVVAGEELKFKVMAYPDTEDMVYTADNLPSGATFSSDHVFVWKPGRSGSYPVTFKVSNGKVEDLKTVAITVLPGPNQPPVAAASATPVSGKAPIVVSFSSSRSSDPDGAITSYRWDFGDRRSSVRPNPRNIYTTKGKRTVRLTVTDDQGASASTTLAITVK